MSISRTIASLKHLALELLTVMRVDTYAIDNVRELSSISLRTSLQQPKRNTWRSHDGSYDKVRESTLYLRSETLLLSRPARPIRTLHLDDLVLLVAKCLSGFTHFVIRPSYMPANTTPDQFRGWFNAHHAAPRGSMKARYKTCRYTMCCFP